VQDFDIDLTEVLNIVDYGDAEIDPEASVVATVSNILAAKAAVEKKVGEVIDAGAIPIVIGQNSPCGSYAIGKAIADRASGRPYWRV
jgi:agmatinase